MVNKRSRVTNSIGNRINELETQAEELAKRVKTPNTTETDRRVQSLIDEAERTSSRSLATELIPFLEEAGIGSGGESGSNSLPVPSNFQVTGMTTGWTETHTPWAHVTFSWNEITPPVGSTAPVEYELWARRTTGPFFLLDSASGNTVTTDKLASGVTYYVKIRARLLSGSWSNFSSEITVVPDAPAPLIPKAPTGLSVLSNTGYFTVTGTAMADITLSWTGVTQDTTNSPIDIAAYEVWSKTGTAEWRSETFVTGTTATIAKPAGTSVQFRLRALSTLSSSSGWSSTVSATAAVPIPVEPKAPTGLNVTANVGRFLSDGTPISSITVAWNPVSQGVDDSPLPVTAYEVSLSTDDSKFFSEIITPNTDATFTVPYGETRYVRVAAQSSSGIWGPPSTSVSFTGATPVHNTTPPSSPILTTTLSTVTPQWDGNLTSGPPPVEFFRLITQYSTTSVTGPWTTVAAPLTQAGFGLTIPGTVGQQVWVRFFWVDTLGRVSYTSAVSNITVQGILGTQIDDTIMDAITDAQTTADSAQTSANGKNKIYYQTSQPSGSSFNVGDTWFDTDDNYKMRTWSGSAWVLTQDSASASAAASAAQATAGSKNASFVQGTTPTATKTGDLWIDTANGNIVKQWNGTAWVSAQDASIGDALTAASTAQTTANGKNRIVRSTAVASGTSGYVAGDQWWQYSGTEIIGMWIYSGSAWVAQTLTDSVITNLNAGSITAGTLDAARIAAGSITTKKLTVGDFTNLIEDPAFASGITLGNRFTGASPWVGSDASSVSAASAVVTSVGPSLRLATQAASNVVVFATNVITVKPGDQFTLSAQMFTGSTTAAVSIRLRTYATGDTNTFTDFVASRPGSASGWGTHSVDIVVPEGHSTAQVIIIGGIDAVSPGSYLYVAYPSLFRRATAELIVDGAVTAGKIAAGSITAGSAIIADGAITTAKIADAAINNAKISTVDAGKVTTGYLSSARIEAKSLTADKLVIAATGNLLANGSFADGQKGWQDVAYEQVVGITDGPNGSSVNVMRISPTGADQGVYNLEYGYSQANGKVYEAGQALYFMMRARVVSGTAGSIRIRLGVHGTGQPNQWPTVAGTELVASSATPGQWVTLTGTYTMPTGNPRDKLAVAIHTSNASGTVFEVSDVVMRPMATGSLIVDGTITGAKLNAAEIWASDVWVDTLSAGLITTNMLASGVGSSINLSQNGSIVLVTGQQAQLSNNLSNLSNSVGAIDQTLSQAVVDIGDAKETASDAAAAAAAAQTTATGAVNGVATLRTVYDFGPTGATISSPSDPTQLRLGSGEIGFYINNTKITWWNSGQFNVTSLVATEAKIGNHKIEKFGTTRTVFRKV